MAAAVSVTAVSRSASTARSTISFAGNSGSAALRKWDGARRTCVKWESWEKDAELWANDGNCLVFLHGKGGPRATPSFRLSFSALLAAKCYPFIARFLVTDDHQPHSPDEITRWHRRNPRRMVELHVPFSTSRQSRDQHVAIRNLLAWATGGSLVGKHLSSTLVALMKSMAEFRSDVEDNARDLLRYLDEKGYTKMANQTHRALAILAFAETFRIKELYTRAFVHCVGMRDKLISSSEYQAVSADSKALIAKARAGMDARLEKTSAMLRNLLDDELSEAHVGISCEIRAHLERFRGFLISYYSAKFGYYPPRSFNAAVYRTMSGDFALLYNLLKDDTFTCYEMMPSTAAGGICTLQLVQSLDTRLDFEPLQHPLPLLPQPERQNSTKRVPWLSRRASTKTDVRRLEHAAIVKASNWKDDIFQNELVRRYRRFEEEVVMSQSKAERKDRVSLADARKVRWILIYAIHQVLRHANTPPPGVVDDCSAHYLLSPAVENLPPWSETCDGIQADASEAMSFVTAGTTPAESPSAKVEIKPDIDYFALTHRESSSQRRRSASSAIPESETPTLERSSSVSRVLGSGSPFRRSVRKLRQATTCIPAPEATSSPCKPLYHEIVVHGYGNGTNDVSFEEGDTTAAAKPIKWASRSGSTASQSCSSASSAMVSVVTPGESVRTSITIPTPPSPCADVCDEPMLEKYWRWSHQESGPSKTVSPASSIARSASLRKRPRSTAAESYGFAKSLIYHAEPDDKGKVPSTCGLTRRHSANASDMKRPISISPTWPTHLPQVIDEEPCLITQDSCDWTAMQAFLDGKATDVDTDGYALSAWEQYNDLGGLTELR
ncbi:hypothetical protein HIM_05687 [Hirsutella minnesotensis 3608]|uniref:DUF8004 domain-containing protein n=1 Tax=Hirsutella minnesotensis 3608 TaxID=1043627 RepID=A0A0F7ZK41_9HYPO|nr:hypothetical protein HIM_05687 [Hirsutella minnesotensis 3608]